MHFKSWTLIAPTTISLRKGRKVPMQMGYGRDDFRSPYNLAS